MSKLVSIIAAAVFVANYAIISSVMILIVDWIDAGIVHWGLWPMPAAIGLLIGIAALLVEVALHHDQGFWPRNFALFFLRVLTTSLFGLPFALL